MKAPTAEFAQLLSEVFDGSRGDLRKDLRKTGEEAFYERLRADFVFHMTDWISDLKKLHAMEEAPEVWKEEDASTFLIGFLYHVIPHLNAAGRLLLGEVGDPFAKDDVFRILERLEAPGSTARR